METKRLAIAFCLVAGLGLSACGGGESEASSDEAAPEATADAPAPEAAAAPAVEPAAAAAPPAQAAPLPGAPQFVALYPGGVVQGEVTAGEAASGEGGIVTFVTAAAPADVVEFYRSRAETSGLSSVMAMTQGDTHAYGARSAQSGDNLSVVASPVDGQTNVQLSWSSGG